MAAQTLFRQVTSPADTFLQRPPKLNTVNWIVLTAWRLSTLYTKLAVLTLHTAGRQVIWAVPHDSKFYPLHTLLWVSLKWKRAMGGWVDRELTRLSFKNGFFQMEMSNSSQELLLLCFSCQDSNFRQIFNVHPRSSKLKPPTTNYGKGFKGDCITFLFGHFAQGISTWSLPGLHFTLMLCSWALQPLSPIPPQSPTLGSESTNYFL